MTDALVRYRAFISYSHRDAGTAAWLHRRLETYRIPKHLTGSITALGTVPARLTPIFRDREDLPAATDLSAAVQAALAVSDSLIVICSPHAAASKWVAKEIETFHALHPDRPVLLAVAEGDPPDCFPQPIRALAAEPLAADLRKSGDGRRLGVLKLIAGMTGLPLDRLAQRDEQRRLRRVMAVTLAAIAGTVTMAVLLALAVLARSESERQRHQAEGLVEFMLTDLRDRLKGVGRLDVMTAVNERAMAYYGSQGDLEKLPPDSLERRARILHAMGEDDEKRGHLDLALAKWMEAQRATAALLAKRPNDPQRIFDHAQSEYWVGYAAYMRHDRARALAKFTAYRALAGQLVAADPAKPEWQREVGYAEGNLCSLALKRPPDATAALKHCEAALTIMVRLARTPDDMIDLSNRHAWLAEAFDLAGRPTDALEHWRQHHAIASKLHAAEPANADRTELLARAELSLAEAYTRSSDPRLRRAAARFAEESTLLLRTLLGRDPSNAEQQRLLARAERAHRKAGGNP